MTHPSKSEREYLPNPYESPRSSNAKGKVVGKMRFIEGAIVIFFLLPLLLAPFCWHEIKLRLPPTSSPWQIVDEFLVIEVLLAIVTWPIGMALVVSSRPSGPFLKISTAVLGTIAFLAAYFLLEYFYFFLTTDRWLTHTGKDVSPAGRKAVLSAQAARAPIFGFWITGYRLLQPRKINGNGE